VERFVGIREAVEKRTGDHTIWFCTPGGSNLEELKEAMGETILLDGIPAILVLPRCSDEEVAGFATRVLDLFAPNLILGVSDELPPPADIEKVRLISELVANYELPTGQSAVSSQ
jgi:hypothetical protein